jgi:hypothetical protein
MGRSAFEKIPMKKLTLLISVPLQLATMSRAVDPSTLSSDLNAFHIQPN